MKHKYIVKLTETERSQLKELISSGEASARQIRRAYILLNQTAAKVVPNGSTKRSVKPTMSPS